MNFYRINYIDGHDLRYKSFETSTNNEKEALVNLWASYPNGDFDHQIVEIIKLDAPGQSGFRIGDAVPFLQSQGRAVEGSAK